MYHRFTIHYPSQPLMHHDAPIEATPWPAFILEDLHRMFNDLHFSATNCHTEQSCNACLTYHRGQTQIAIDLSIECVVYKPCHEPVQFRPIMEETSACLKACDHLDPLAYWEIVEDLQGNILKGSLMVVAINNHSPHLNNLYVVTQAIANPPIHAHHFPPDNHRPDIDRRDTTSSHNVLAFLQRSSRICHLITTDEETSMNPLGSLPAGSSKNYAHKQHGAFCMPLFKLILRSVALFVAYSKHFLLYLADVIRFCGATISKTIRQIVNFISASMISAVLAQYFSQVSAQFKHDCAGRQSVCQLISNRLTPRNSQCYAKGGSEAPLVSQLTQAGTILWPSVNFSIF